MKKTVMIAGGGTGGHIYPAIAIGRALQKANPAIELRFVGTAEGLESKIMNRENLALDLIKSGKLNYSGNILQKLKTLFRIPLGLAQSFALIRRHNPVFVIGVGGYASAPFVLMAALMGRNTAIWEPNAHPGMANRLLSKIVKRAYLVFGDSRKYLASTDVKVFGMPLREEIELAQGSSKTAQAKLRLLCFGGSQGSMFLNEKLSDFLLKHPELHSRLEVIHQTGTRDFENIKKKYAGLACVEVHEFIFNMPEIYKKTDVQFCRGGASTIAEASAFGIVPIIVPLPAADDHQLRNAEVVAEAKAGFLIEQGRFNDADFAEKLTALLENVSLRNEMSENLKKLAPKNAAGAIAHDILAQI
jgi:UDP-N-acetylglucosamine--N-acetylmuramyl-(pentapeptide) pyrophosphoryl-undecaprenol N-acetylglucosamine transferase